MTDRQKITAQLLDTFVWRDTPGGLLADLTGWWRDPGVLRGLGPALAELHTSPGVQAPTVVVGVETRGLVLGPLTALHLGVGFVEVRKRAGGPGAFGAARLPEDALLHASTPPGYEDGGMTLVTPRGLVGPGERVLLVDEWIDTGAQATAVRRMVVGAGAEWAGAAVIVDACDPRVRERLDVRGLLREDDLPGWPG